MTLRLTLLIFLSSLAGCSSTQLKAFGGHVVHNVVGLASGVLRDDNVGDANAWVPAYQRCDSVCAAKRQAASARLADEHNRRLRRERKEKTEDAFDEFMNELQAAENAPDIQTPIVIVDAGYQPF